MVEWKGHRDAEHRRGSEGALNEDAREDARRAKRMSILLTGARLFNERGYDQTKLEDIAAELNVSKRTLYYYIKNKDDILAQCNTLAYETLEPTLTVCSDRTIPPLERISLLMLAYARALTHDFGACLVLTRENTVGSESFSALREIRRRLDRVLRGLVEEGIADGTITSCEPSYTSAALFGAFNWLPHWRTASKKPSYEEIGNMFLRVFFDGLRISSGTGQPVPPQF